MAPLSWVYRSLLLNQFTSEEYNDGSGDIILDAYGITLNGEPFERAWIWYGFAYLIPFLLLCTITSTLCLQYLRAKPNRVAIAEVPESTEEDSKQTGKEAGMARSTSIPFKDDGTFVPVNLSFNNLCYEVKSSKGGENLQLLNNVSGVFSSGRMCALMGESGAGKTTLMDVVAMRKASGNVTGDVLLNGFPQETYSFRRVSGYVEQFDVQTAELTVKETILFSAKLRLDESNPVFLEPNGLDKHVEQVIHALELTSETNMLVGSEEGGGLSFEQKKRLSIAVEVAASPAIIFLDEPTSGLDARAALIVMTGLRKICNTGRTVVATIHQPSSTVFEMFDDLLLLKKGGYVVYSGDLGTSCSSLISYFEKLGVSPICKGQNPSTWMLNVLGEEITVKGGNGEDERLDFAKAWSESENFQRVLHALKHLTDTKDAKMEIKFDLRYAASKKIRNKEMAIRLCTIYWRSPAYNLSRLALSVFIAFLMSSIFIPIRNKDVFNETEISSMLGTIFISFIIIGVLSITSVLPVMLSIRDMFYRHKAAGMIGSSSVGRALATAEKGFILISSLLFCLIFIPLSGINETPSETLRTKVGEGVAFWGFFTFNVAIYSYMGQLFMCLMRGQATAQILASVFIGINNFFSGFIVRPQRMVGGFWAFTYWINPGHFIYEGLVMSVFWNDNREVIVGLGSDYWSYLDCDKIAAAGQGVCKVDVSVYVNAFFGGEFHRDHIPRNLIILSGILLAVRAGTFVALNKLQYSGK